MSGPAAADGADVPPRVLTINGLGRPAHDFVAFQGRTHAAFQVVAYDSRFVGLSERRSAGLLGRVTSASLADDALDVLRALGWADGRGVHVVGYSLGGMAAQELCLRAPGHVRSLSLCVTYSGGSLASILPPLCFRFRSFLEEALAARRLGAPSEVEELAQVGAVMIGGRRDEGEAWNSVLAEQRRRAGLYGLEMGGSACASCGTLLRHAWAAAGHHLSGSRLERLRELPFPKHIFGSSGYDNLVQHANSVPLAAAIRARVAMYDGAGHDLFVGHSQERFMDDLCRFISQSESEAAGRDGGERVCGLEATRP